MWNESCNILYCKYYITELGRQKDIRVYPQYSDAFLTKSLFVCKAAEL